MSLGLSLTLHHPRKRTNSFSYSSDSPRPTKSQRMAVASPLKRSESMLFLPTPDLSSPQSSLPCYYQRLRRKQSNSEQLTIRIHNHRRPSSPSPAPKPTALTRSTPKPAPTTPLPPPPTRGRSRTPTAPSKVILPSISNPVTTVLTPRTSSPLSPKRVPLPGRPVFPRSKKSEPDLYRMAIRMRMLLSPEGQKILSLGPRVAMQMEVERKVGMEMEVEQESVKQEADRTRRDIMSVTRDLERMVEDICDEDILMDCIPTTTTSPSTTTSTATLTTPPAHPTPAPPILTTSWVLVKGEDWEMVDSTA